MDLTTATDPANGMRSGTCIVAFFTAQVAVLGALCTRCEPHECVLATLGIAPFPHKSTDTGAFGSTIDGTAKQVPWFDLRGNHDSFNVPSWESDKNLYSSHGVAAHLGRASSALPAAQANPGQPLPPSFSVTRPSRDSSHYAVTYDAGYVVASTAATG